MVVSYMRMLYKCWCRLPFAKNRIGSISVLDIRTERMAVVF